MSKKGILASNGCANAPASFACIDDIYDIACFGGLAGTLLARSRADEAPF
jgi:hypothetical protein